MGGVDFSAVQDESDSFQNRVYRRDYAHGEPQLNGFSALTLTVAWKHLPLVS